jgi:polyhydroxyalkanoate synthesis repressor PhaR
MAKTNIPQIVIKKYANRRLYNTSTSTYVTLDDLCDMIKRGTDFGVYDAKNGDDLTRQVLTQIIVEQEAKGINLLPVGFLKKLISYYGGNLQLPVAKFLEEAMGNFNQNRDRIQRQWNDAVNLIPGMGALNEMSKQNMAMLENTMRMFNPFGAAGSVSSPTAAPGFVSEVEYNRLKAQLIDLQRQLNAAKKPK